MTTISPAAATQARNLSLEVLAVCVGIESLLFFWLCSFGHDGFIAFIWTPDTSEYVRIAQHLTETFTLTPSPRTLGYPLFLALGYLVGGRSWPYVIVIVQLLLNIALTWGVWRLLQQLVPNAGIRLRATATFFFFWAGLGMALYLMTDFLASFFFGVFLYGMLFWRTRPSILLSGTCLALATLTRPTFTYLPFLLPAAFYLAGRVTSKATWPQLVAFMACSLGATGVSVMYQYTAYTYLGPSPVLLLPIEEALYYGVVQHQRPGTDYISFKKEFEAEVEKRADRRFATLTPAEQETYAKQIFREELLSHPTEIATNYIKNFIKYMFVPVESNLMRVVALFASEQTYLRYVRPILGLVCLPVWLLSLIPPINSPKKYRMYYLLAMVLLVYVIGISAISTGSGERIRFPLLAFMLPIMVWNVDRAHRYLHGVTSGFRETRLFARNPV